MTPAADVPPRLRRAGRPITSVERELPSTPRGVRTRAKLIAAARVVFERDGYLDARLVDITTEAGTSAGSFYTYFESKEEVFTAVLADVEEEMLHPAVRKITDGDDPVAVIRESNRAYLESYRRNTRFMQLLDQVASIDEEFREVRRRRGDAFTRRNARGIRDLQARGLADPDVNPLLAASILSGMVGRAAYTNFVLGEDWDFEELVESLTRLWAGALHINMHEAKSVAPERVEE